MHYGVILCILTIGGANGGLFVWFLRQNEPQITPRMQIGGRGAIIIEFYSIIIIMHQKWVFLRQNDGVLQVIFQIGGRGAYNYGDFHTSSPMWVFCG